ncbi:hypothetical protein [Nonomuraea sp. NEAU-A123]|uniref:hypothetical protein n=1 Tax=Nonomuraea sp. NEAU-A123 TaxID=2839649 RepID=UPI001BE3D596|nr:hypothetical protein [Nonomuraea sp. NEAU-A123]MBT2226289.1 hypothetical protein [Nonomuraea sp. NEAU-A123]
MTATNQDLAGLPHRSTEQIKLYGRSAERVFRDLSAEMDFRAGETRAQVIGLIKAAHKLGFGDGKNPWFRAIRIAFGYSTAHVSCIIARRAVRSVHENLEKECAAELDGFRTRKYGKQIKRKPERKTPVLGVEV